MIVVTHDDKHDSNHNNKNKTTVIEIVMARRNSIIIMSKGDPTVERNHYILWVSDDPAGLYCGCVCLFLANRDEYLSLTLCVWA